MKKIFFVCACMCLPVMAHAELKKVALKSATATSQEANHGGYEGPSDFAIDGDPSTFWSSSWSNTTMPVTFTIELADKSHVDLLRYVPRSGGGNGSWDHVKVEYSTGKDEKKGWTALGEFHLRGSGDAYEFPLGEKGLDKVMRFRFTVNSGVGGYASAAEIEAFTVDNTTQRAWQKYFVNPLMTELKPNVKSDKGIKDEVLKALVNNLLGDSKEYKKFRVAEYEPYRDIYSLQRELKTSAPYNQWENPTGIYLKAGDECYVAVSGITTERVGLKIKNWVQNEDASSYSLRNGLNKVTAQTEGNVFVDYYTDNYKTAPNVKIHFINAPVRGYWDQSTMTNEDWKKLLAPFSDNDSTVLIVRSEHAQVAYPVCAWKKWCPENVDSVMTLYQQIQWGIRNMMGLEKYGRQAKNRQLFFATKYGFMAAGGNGAFCHIDCLESLMTPDATKFGFWGVGHEWGHNNQINGFCWSGCGETTNNIYASWVEMLFNHQDWCRMEDEYTGQDDYSNMRGGRMQVYFEESLRKGMPWQLNDGPDYHHIAPDTVTVPNIDYEGKPMGSITTTYRNYDHFVKLMPFWQLNLWGTLAGKSPDIIPMVIEGIRQTNGYNEAYDTNGKLQMNFMKLACDSAGLNLLPFFERAGMLKPINAYIADYGSGWNKISEKMIADLKAHVKAKGYPDIHEEVNYINVHNYKVYRDRLPLQVPAKTGTGCTNDNKGKVKVMHADVKNAVAFETYNAKDSLIRITMYALGSDPEHTFTQVLYPVADNKADAAAYIMAVGYDGTRKKIYESKNVVKGR